MNFCIEFSKEQVFPECIVNTFSANFTNWSNTLKQFVGSLAISVPNYGLNKNCRPRLITRETKTRVFWLEICNLLSEIRKITGFTSLRVNCREIHQVTKIPNGFFRYNFEKRSKTEQVNITIEFYIFKIV